MQGSDAPSSIISAMDQVIGSGSDFDVLVMIRGGGAATDLHCYDNYDLAANIAQFPIPVITGIGHHKDVHIADRVAHLALKTPTAVADYLDGHLAAEEEGLFRLSHNLERTVQRRIEDEKQSLNYFLRDIGGAVRWLLQQQEHLLELMEQRIKHNNPMNLLNKGYSLTLFRGKAVLDASLLKEGDKVQTILSKGSFGAVVHDIEN
jgi:exodeoxyribonuclease VII large subunit